MPFLKVEIEELSNVLHDYIEIYRQYEELMRKRSKIEFKYAKSLEKLVKNHDNKQFSQPYEAKFFTKALDNLKNTYLTHLDCSEYTLQGINENRLDFSMRHFEIEKKQCIKMKKKLTRMYFYIEYLLKKKKKKFETSLLKLEKVKKLLQTSSNDKDKHKMKKYQILYERKLAKSSISKEKYEDIKSRADKFHERLFDKELPDLLNRMKALNEQKQKLFDSLNRMETSLMFKSKRWSLLSQDGQDQLLYSVTF